MSEAPVSSTQASAPPPGHEPEASPEPGAKPVALDTDDTLGWHVLRLARKRLTLWGGALLTIGAGVGAGVAAGPAIGAAAAAGAVVLVIAAVVAAAYSAAAADFFRGYAESRGLSLAEGKGGLPPVTPLLRKGDRRYSEHAMSGPLPGGIEGTLARFTYEEDTHDSDGDRQTSYYKFSVVLGQIPEAAARLRELYVERRSGFRFLDGAEDAFRRRMVRLELESDALDRRYEIFHHTDDDPIYMRELFTPKFIVWLAEEAPKDFAFEFVAGALCVNTKGHCDNAVELDALCEAAGRVRNRLHSEAIE